MGKHKKVVRALTRKQPELNVVIISIWLLHKILQVGIKQSHKVTPVAFVLVFSDFYICKSDKNY